MKRPRRQRASRARRASLTDQVNEQVAARLEEYIEFRRRSNLPVSNELAVSYACRSRAERRRWGARSASLPVTLAPSIKTRRRAA